jgi:TolA-binding protein
MTDPESTAEMQATIDHLQAKVEELSGFLEAKEELRLLRQTVTAREFEIAMLGSEMVNLNPRNYDVAQQLLDRPKERKNKLNTLQFEYDVLQVEESSGNDEKTALPSFEPI